MEGKKLPNACKKRMFFGGKQKTNRTFAKKWVVILLRAAELTAGCRLLRWVEETERLYGKEMTDAIDQDGNAGEGVHDADRGEDFR